MIISSYFIYMMSEFNLLYSNYMNTLDSFGRHNLPQMIREITQLQQMYTILPEPDVALTDQSIYRVYSTHGIIDYKYFLYHHNSMGELHNMMEDNPLLASVISNAIKQNIINNHHESNLLITDIFVKHAITLAAPFLGGVLALIAIYTIENIVLLSQGVLA
jgi:alpha-glucuronidase